MGAIAAAVYFGACFAVSVSCIALMVIGQALDWLRERNARRRRLREEARNG